jgi:hypothetical protein
MINLILTIDQYVIDLRVDLDFEQHLSHVHIPDPHIFILSCTDEVVVGRININDCDGTFM